jgi:ABC-type amino acid transport substrate-binding protein
VDDLPGQLIGVATGSTAEDFAREAGLRFLTFPHIDESVPTLLDGRIAAIVGDAPVLEYYQHTHPDVPVDVVGPIFEPEKYGFGVTLGSPLLTPLTIELLAAKESDLIEQLRAKYFGEGP